MALEELAPEERTLWALELENTGTPARRAREIAERALIGLEYARWMRRAAQIAAGAGLEELER